MGRSTGKDSIAMISKVFYQNLLGLNVLTIKLEQ